ncbi:L-ascorbate metabolism protein UlaG, beta-lactamase superfamily [Amycolatopsis marina]|uniref:L-ascorbate metabolism protein UlaG, beta-lactamase superfamily n=1 Tax=Amycolatopsis marina TaxID=490629 RepID=A0A1I1BVX8_9PSEU|nr:MBL fold metallo-hydrolase [Amycolatopsis marina]SFB54441.1 L-ascorbate metabolism protein UlaG, beta-lactamase superfamily [Amycolatopsis marina]
MTRVSYRDRLTSPLPRPQDLYRILREGGFRGPTDNADRIPVLRGGLPSLEPGTSTWTWIGHSTYLVRTGGISVLTDPVWSTKIPGVPPRLTPPGVAWADLPEIDAVLISHDHYDHLDAPTVRKLPRHTPILVGAGLGRWFRKRGFSEVVELDWWESAEVGGVRFDFTPAHHWSRRSMFDTCRSLWGGWVITPQHGPRSYHCGDSGYGTWFGEIGDRYPGIEVAMMPIGAYEPRWFMRAVHMDPAEAVRALGDLGARRLAAMHWGTFVLTREPVEQPLELIRKEWATAGRDAADLWALAVGETRVLEDRA